MNLPFKGVFKVSDTEFGAYTENGIFTVWNNTFAAISMKDLGIRISTMICYVMKTADGKSFPYLVCGTQFQDDPNNPNKYGILITDGTNKKEFRVSFCFLNSLY